MQDSPVVLVVEDDPQMQALIEVALNEGGFSCMIAASGEEAKDLFQDEVGKYRALLTDINLSRTLDGWEVARHARRLNPDIPVIYMTGDAADQWASSGVPHSIILSKPFAPSQVVIAVAQLLNISASPNSAVQTGEA
jgi:CheY-like chemotaxis protein